MQTAYFRLSLFIFIQYFIPGAYIVTLATYALQVLAFSGTQVGILYSTFALGALVSPFITGILTDKYVPLNRMLIACYLASGILMLICVQCETFVSFLGWLMLYQLCFAPTFGLSSAKVLHHVGDAMKEYPRIRVWGTVGWIAAGLLVGLLNWDATARPMYISALMAFAGALYCFFLPVSKLPNTHKEFRWRSILGLDALRLVRKPSLLVLIVSLWLLSLATAFYDSFANPFLVEIGMRQAAAKMTWGQWVEIPVILLMPVLFRNMKIRYILWLGMLAWVVRYVLFAQGNMTTHRWMLYVGIGLHGVAYAFTFLTAQLYIDRHTPTHLRNSMQGLMSLVSMGGGRLVGSYIAGVTVAHYTLWDGSHLWSRIWYWPALIAAFVCVGFLVSLPAVRRYANS